MRLRTKSLLLAALAFACDEPQLGPEAAAHIAPPDEAHAPRVHAAVYWNQVARSLVKQHGANPFQAVRAYAIVSIAQYNGAVAAAEPPRDNPRPSVIAAITQASVDALTYVWPADSAALRAMAAEFLSQNRRNNQNEDEEAGAAAGAAAAATIIERAKTDRFFVPWTGTVPAGPGNWYSSANPPAPPVAATLGQARTFLVRSGSQFRPEPPPDFNSPQFLAAVAEVRHFADTRTTRQDSLAKFWAFPTGTYTPFGYWNEEAARLAIRYRLSEITTAHLFALMNMAAADAVITSHDTKYTYWLLRPSQAEPAIQLAIGLPNFPSYMSNHAALSGCMARIIGAWFPSERARLDDLADEAAMSRLYAGIHYRFDNETGLRVGRRIAWWALERDVRDGQPFALD
jgi:hypothetical protein